MRRLVTGVCPGRVCLVGEDLDWLGGASVMAAIAKHVEIVGSRRTEAPAVAPITLSWPAGGETAVVRSSERKAQYTGAFLDVAEACCRVFMRQTV